MKKVIVIGGGWAGLAAAVELAQHRVPVTVLEAARQLGGRARSVRFDQHRVDNGQHILLGAYQTVLTLLTLMGVSEQTVLRRKSLKLVLREQNGPGLRLAAPALLPAPLHTLWALATAGGLSLKEKVLALAMLRKIKRRGFALSRDIPLSVFLHRYRQGPSITRAFWQPLCLATLNTDVNDASTELFVNVVRAAFFGHRAASDLLLPIADLGRCFPEPAREFVELNGGSVRLGARVQALHIEHGHAKGVVLDRETLSADDVIVATCPKIAADLLGEHSEAGRTTQSLKSLSSAPICTVYLQYPTHVTLPEEFVGLLDTTTQWLFDRGRLSGERGLMAAIISAAGAHMKLDANALTQLVAREIAQHFPHWPAPTSVKLIREKRATFAAYPSINEMRPASATAIRGLWLAGDYTATRYPSTLEGAALSGVQCARLILNG